MEVTKKALKEGRILRQGKDLVKKLENATVAICGLGGLGSNVANALVRAGVGKLILIDYDKVEASNLQRQQFKANQVGLFKAEALKANLLEIDPYANLELAIEKVSTGNMDKLLSEAQIICEAFDKAENKAMLVNYVLENMPDKYLVAASGMAGLGKDNDIKARQVTEKFFICGDGTSDVSNDIIISSRVLLCAASQANTIIKILARKD